MLAGQGSERCMPDADQTLLSGPKLALRQTSWRGPFAFSNATLSLRPARFSVINTARSECTLQTISADPLQADPSGTEIPSFLVLTLETPQARKLPANQSGAITLSGTVPARPGSYLTTVRVAPQDGPALLVPVSLAISSATIWGLLCMVAGLLLLGSVELLNGEGTVKTQLTDALRARQDIHTQLEATPAPQSRSGDVDAMDADFDAAIASLGARRRFSVVDHRQEDAQAHLAAALARAKQLRADLSGQSQGVAEIEDVRADWRGLQATLQQIATLPANAATAGLEGKLDGVLGAFREKLLRRPALLTTAEIDTEFGRMSLEEAAGEGGAARDLALTTRLWLRRSARDLNQALTGYRVVAAEAGWMLNTNRILRDRAAHDDLTPEARAAILDRLDRAAALLDGNATLEQFARAGETMNAAWSAQVGAASDMQKQRMTEDNAAIDHQTDYGDTTDLVDRMQSAPLPHTLASKQATMNQVLAMWRAHVTQVSAPDMRAGLERDITGAQAALDAGDLKGFGDRYQALMAGWADWQGKLYLAASDRRMHARCLEYFADTQRNAARIEADLRARPPGFQTNAWDRRLDAIRVRMQRQGPDSGTVSHDCMTPLLAIGKSVNDLSGEIFSANLRDVLLPAATRLRFAQASGVAGVVSAIEADLSRPRPLTLLVRTPDSERVIGRDIMFDVAGADPVWGSSVAIDVDFGDGTHAGNLDAERLRQGARLAHAYATSSTAHATVTAIEYGGSPASAGSTLGEGALTVLIAPNPVGTARRLADEFLNLRFALALLVSSTVYYWRYHRRTTVFGANGYDYVEAFAVGFAADAAVSNLPQALQAFAPG